MANAVGNPGTGVEELFEPGDAEAGLKLLDEVVLGVGRPRKALTMEIVRGLTEEDLPAIAEGAEPGGGAPELLKIKYSHHQLAQLIAKGLDMQEVSLITGYSPSYISTLKGSQAFAELLDFYSHQRQALYVDVLERMKGLGMMTIEELQSRLHDEPEKWTKRELMDMAKLMFGEGVARPQGAGGGGNGNSNAGVNIEVKFVSGRSPSAGAIIDAEVVRG